MFAKLIDEETVCIFTHNEKETEGQGYAEKLKKAGFLPLCTRCVPSGYTGALRYTKTGDFIVASPLL